MTNRMMRMAKSVCTAMCTSSPRHAGRVPSSLGVSDFLGYLGPWVFRHWTLHHRAVIQQAASPAKTPAEMTCAPHPFRVRRGVAATAKNSQVILRLTQHTIIGILLTMNRYEVRLLDHAVRFLSGLPVKLRAKAFRGIDLLRELGPDLPMPHGKALKGTGGLRELRIKFASDIVRLFYFHHGGRVYVITSGFVKKAGKTDPRELQRAIRLMREIRGDKR